MTDAIINKKNNKKKNRRDFLALSAVGLGAAGAASFAYTLVNSMNPSKDVLALASTVVDISEIEEGQRITISWRGKPVFIWRRSETHIADAKNTTMNQLLDPEDDSKRVKKDEILIVVGVCTHLGCIPLGQKDGEIVGKFGGWFCPCHGSLYDTSGRVRKGPAPSNLAIPPYEFLDDDTVKIG